MACLIRLDNGQIFNITNKIDIIGRGSSASIFLDDDGVSRNHAEIFMMSGCVEVIDLNSRNGISVNGEKVRKSFLNNDDKLSVGTVDMVFSHGEVDTNKTINVAASEVNSPSSASIKTSSSGRFELTQIKASESLLKFSKFNHSLTYLELLFKAALELNSEAGDERFSKIVYSYIQKNLAPALCVIKVNDKVLSETPTGSAANANGELVENTLQTGTSFLRKKSNSVNDGTSAISCSILGPDSNVHGYIYLETTSKNFEIEDILFVRALASLAAGISLDNLPVKTLPQTNSQFYPEQLLILGSSDPVVQLKSRINDVANQQTVMISGPMGTDRRVIASNIHCMSDHAEKPYVYVDCSSLNPAVLHESLFGRPGISEGKFGQAQDGTLFLNRICCLDQEIQELLHLYLQTSSIIPLGESEPQKINVQLVLGIRGKPEDAVKRGVLCENLLSDLKGKRIHMPHLKDRREDILEITEHYFKRFTKKYRKAGMVLAESSKEVLVNYPWPGNDRELDLILERAVLCCDHKELTPEYLALPGVN
ncbi:MAG: sigma 54-interacting transcriptional regulator [Lentisphaeraceae bacterium]|nr:sigma 54-interacting transcriptional regulator [Lentisphaeraceae bacterium]